MCGICGVCFTRSGRPAESDLVERMCACIVHRGPDEQGTHIDGPVGLGIRRLSIIDLATGSQPIFNEDRTVAVVFNGEIYNFQQLRTDLKRHGHHFTTEGDTEVIVHLYEDHGVDFVKHLNGMFAIALWDRQQQRFMLVRDRLGKKPVYYAWVRDGLVFGSELKCIFQCKDVPSDLDHKAIYHYFTLGYIPNPQSIYHSVRQLPPAGRLVIEGNCMNVDRYWALTNKFDPTANRQEACEHLRALLADSVRLRMISDVPLGAFLSGGLDSSIVVALMAQHSASPIKTFHIDFDEPQASEAAYARAVAQRYGTEHHELVVKPSAIAILDELVGFFDEPFGDSSAVPTFFVSQLTRQHVTVALSGDGGDESFGGYERYQRILVRRNLPRMVRAAMGVLGKSIHACLPRLAPGRRYFRSLGMDHGQYFTVGTAELETRELLSREFLDSIESTSTFDLLRPPLEIADSKDPLARYTSWDIRHYLPDDILTKVDRMSMANSLEVRSPFLDYRVVELAASFPHNWKINGNDQKVILKKAFAGDLPAEILKQRKQGFSIPLAQWLREDLREVLNEALHDAKMEDSGVFNMKEVRALAKEHISGRRDRSDQLWQFLFFVRWWHKRYQSGTAR